MAFNWISLPVIILFIINASSHLYYGFLLNRKFSNEHNICNTIFTCILWIIAGLLYPFYFNNNQNTLYFEIISVWFITIITPIIIFVILFYQYHYVTKKKGDVKEKRNIDMFIREFDKKHREENSKSIYSLKIDIYRKSLHLFPAIFIIFLWVFAIYIWEGIWNINLIWNISGFQFGRFLIITLGYSGILLFATLDYVRLSYIFKKRNIFYLLPDKVSNMLQKSLKRNEIFEFTKPVVLILSFTPIFFLPFGIFAAASLIGTIGDGIASIFGLKYGTRHFPKNSDKTIIGYIAGSIASFVISFICVIIFFDNIYIFKIILIAVGGALSFFVIDLSNINIDDNILNPLLSGVIMGLLFFFI
ncbi:MAG: hypothetical protein JXA99_04155 [Candidatus Lokiarchaeota archaeon]|nr:hypothetical protein [Candidatus Lokiarchaeota archaeon]